MRNSLRKLISTLLIGTQLAQPLLVAATEYRIPLRFKLQPSTPGVGDGIVDPGENPTPAKLVIKPEVLQFDITEGKRGTGTALLMNTGTSDTTMSGIASSPDFSVRSNCPKTLAAGDSCILSITPTASAEAGAQHQLSVLAPTALEPAVAQLSTYVQTNPDPVPHLVLDSNIVNLGVDIEPGATVAGGTTLHNIGKAPAILGGIASDSKFKVTTDCPTLLPAGGKCSISASFSSYVPTIHWHMLELTSGAGIAPTYLTFQASVKQDQAKQPLLVFNKSSLSFGPLVVGESQTKAATLSNVGTAPAELAPFDQSDDFSVVDNCPASLPVGGSCDVSVTFTALVEGTTPLHILVARAEGNAKVMAKLLNQGSVKGVEGPAPQIAFSEEALPFSPMPVGQTTTLRATLSNTGELAASVKNIDVDYGRDVFSQSNDCGTSIAPNASCTVTVIFKALAAKSRDGRVNAVLNNGAGAVMSLSGTGQGASLAAPTSIAFDAIALPGASPVRRVDLGNTGNVPLTGLSITNTDSRLSIGHGDCTDTLQPGKGCSLVLRYLPVTDGTLKSSFTVASSNGGSQTISVTGSATRLSVAPMELVFPTTKVGTTVADQSVRLTNNGQAPVPLDGVDISGGRNSFSRQSDCGATLAANASCMITVRYVPSPVESNETETQRGALSISSNNTEVGHVSLSGSAWNPQLELSETVLHAPATGVGQSAAPLSFTVSNPTEELVRITGMSIVDGASDFGQSNDCGTELAPGANCTVSVQFTPTKAGERPGLWTAVTSLGTYGVVLGGTGTLTLKTSASALNFPPTNVGKSSLPLTVFVTNPTPVTATFSGRDEGMEVSVGGTDFGQSNNCDTELLPGASCAVSIQFTPTGVEERRGTWSMVSSFGTTHVGLSGVGTKPEGVIKDETGGGGPGPGPSEDKFIHHAITFLDTEVGLSSVVRNISFTNKGTGPLAIQGISQANGDADFNMTNDCGAVLQAGTKCTISLLFTPSKLGGRTGQVILLSDTGNYSFDMSGKGTGAEGQWGADVSTDFGDVAIGESMQRSFTLRNTGALLAKNISASVVGADVAFVSNACGTATSPVSLAAGRACQVVVKYSPSTAGPLADAKLLAVGGFVNSPATLELAGNAPPPALAFDAAPKGDLGDITVNTTNERIFTLRNTGKFADTLKVAPDLTGNGFSLAGGTCAKDQVLAANGTCTVIVSANPSSVGAIAAKLSAASVQGATTQLALSASVIQTTYMVSGTPGADTKPTTNFGELTAGTSPPVTSYYYLRDNTAAATVATSLIALQGDSSYVITDVAVVSHAGAVVSGCTPTTSGYTAQCSAGAAGRALRVGVKFAPATAGTKLATLRLAHNGAQGSHDVQLSGSALFNPTAAWSTDYRWVAPPTTENLAFTTLTPGITAEKTMYVQNVGTHGPQAVGFVLSGDTSQFSIVKVVKNRTWDYPVSACLEGGTIATDSLSSTPCRADDVALGIQAAPVVAVTIRFAPTKSGDFSITLTPTTNNGTFLPEPVKFTGSAKFNPTAVWSTSHRGAAPVTAENLAFTTVTPDATVEKTIYVQNEGTHGPQAVGFSLSGDTSQFRIVKVGKSKTWDTPVSACSEGGALAPDSLSATPCRADDVALGIQGAPVVAVTIRFAPTKTGDFAITLTPTTNNGTVLPEPIKFTGSAKFNPTAVWSYSDRGVAPVTAEYLTFSALTQGTTAERLLYMPNVGTYGPLSVGFVISGDTSQFNIVNVGKIRIWDSSATACSDGGAIAPDSLSTTPCRADDITQGNGRTQVRVTVRFAPTKPGDFSITLTPTTNNGTTLPEPITLKGTAK